MTSELSVRGLVAAFSTNLLRVTRSDFCSLVLPDADSGELRLTILYNPICDGAIIPLRLTLPVSEHLGECQRFGGWQPVSRS
jgi:formate hydrogenlyase transcriptional activator